MYEMMITYTNNLIQHVKYYQREREEEAKGENPKKGREPVHRKSRTLKETEQQLQSSFILSLTV